MNIHPQFLNNVFLMSENAVGKVEKSILNPDQSQNLIHWYLAEDLLVHKIWLKSVNNF